MRYEWGTEVDVFYPLEKWEPGYVVVGEKTDGSVVVQKGDVAWLEAFKPADVRPHVGVLEDGGTDMTMGSESNRGDFDPAPVTFKECDDHFDWHMGEGNLDDAIAWMLVRIAKRLDRIDQHLREKP